MKVRNLADGKMYEMPDEDETYWVVHPWGARLCLAVTFCAGMAIGALLMVTFVVVGR